MMAGSARRRRILRWIRILILGGVLLGVFDAGRIVTQRARIESLGQSGFLLLMEAKVDIQELRFSEGEKKFREAQSAFHEAQSTLGMWRHVFLSIPSHTPLLSRAISGVALLEAGEQLSETALDASVLAPGILSTVVSETKNPKQAPLLSLLAALEDPILQMRTDMERVSGLLDRVHAEDIPLDRREEFLRARDMVLTANDALRVYENNSFLLRDLLGGNGPRKYLFLFQNNHELRATGGFIGSYALLEWNNGWVKNFHIDGIFDPDGQLSVNVIPPKPLQKVSAAWSLHDSNWYPDFPRSAEKAAWFFEKTGNPTVDGVIALSPEVIREILRVIGPVELPEYGVMVDADSVVPILQEEVEADYDRDMNEPKKILSDLAPEILTRVFRFTDLKQTKQLLSVVGNLLNERHIVLYARDDALEERIDAAGWSGKIKETDSDYVSVIHSNINGFKTDGVIEESHRHEVDIEEDGSIVDTLSITRTHTGGDTPYEWWNKVNADYLRVYVPRGSELLSVTGTTWEFPKAPIQYEDFPFVTDPGVVADEATERIHPSGTRVSEESGKTVFGAWVYVSPKETVTVTLKYRLPFRLRGEDIRPHEATRFSVLYQKQAGTTGVRYESILRIPPTFQSIWRTAGLLLPYEHELRQSGVLSTDVFLGAVFKQKDPS